MQPSAQSSSPCALRHSPHSVSPFRARVHAHARSVAPTTHARAGSEPPHHFALKVSSGSRFFAWLLLSASSSVRALLRSYFAGLMPPPASLPSLRQRPTQVRALASFAPRRSTCSASSSAPATPTFQRNRSSSGSSTRAALPRTASHRIVSDCIALPRMASPRIARVAALFLHHFPNPP